MALNERPELSQLTTRSERVKRVAALSGRSFRAKESLFRIEGPQGVRSLLEQRPELTHWMYATKKALTNHPELEVLALRQEIPLTLVTPEVISAMVKEQGHQGVANPQGVVAVARQCDSQWRTIVDALPQEGPVTVIVCERIQDPGNAGVVIRTADAAGADAVFFGEDSADVFSPKVVRSSVGSLLHLPVARKVPVRELLGALSRLGIRSAATSPYGTTDLFAKIPPARIAWVLGNEGAGLEERTLEECDSVVRIPLYGRAESLNLATAATLCLYESARHHGESL